MASSTKLYTDIFKKPLTADDVTLAVRTIVQSKRRPTSSLLQRRLGWGYGKVLRVYELLEDAEVVSTQRSDATRTLILKTEAMAVNAALRQLRKGNG